MDSGSLYSTIGAVQRQSANYRAALVALRGDGSCSMGKLKHRPHFEASEVRFKLTKMFLPDGE